MEITKKITERYCEATAEWEQHRREVRRCLKDLRAIWRPQELSRKCEVLPLLQRSLEDIQLCATSSAIEPPLLGQRTGRLSRTSSFGPVCSDSEGNAPQHISEQRPSAREDATPRAHKCAEHNAKEETGSPRHQVRSRSAGEEDKWQRFRECQRRRHQDDYHGSQRIGESEDEGERRLRPRKEVRRDTRSSRSSLDSLSRDSPGEAASPRSGSRNLDIAQKRSRRGRRGGRKVQLERALRQLIKILFGQAT